MSTRLSHTHLTRDSPKHISFFPASYTPSALLHFPISCTAVCTSDRSPPLFTYAIKLPSILIIRVPSLIFKYSVPTDVHTIPLTFILTNLNLALFRDTNAVIAVFLGTVWCINLQTSNRVGTSYATMGSQYAQSVM